MRINIVRMWDCLTKLKPHETFTAAKLATKFGIENPKSISPILSNLYRMGVLDQAGRDNKMMIWKRTEKAWRPGLKLIRPSTRPLTRGPKHSRRKKKETASVVVANGAIHAVVEIRTEKFALLDDVREWLTAEGVEYTMQIVK